ncbi:aldo/keto reductase [Thalassomonas haliotis]|uniref:Aldo/keto reductase n=1 Tax=Thalassomonas haliotis TaxID=485448 RepID=A0ABY7VAE8_9GAMM|nr:aldo/keto reductase [Thalassomonas haliotis]WDE10608.1 aldo/keto reductase [Thalassomonas haliotis]
MINKLKQHRRDFIKLSAASLAAGFCLNPLSLLSAAPAPTDNPQRLTKVIPSTGEKLPAIGMGSWMTFNVGQDQGARQNCLRILRAFFNGGGALIDSSPMYGSSEQVIGYCLGQLNRQNKHFSATKVWTPFQSGGVKQIHDSHRLWGVTNIKLMQIHNLLSWEKHLETLEKLKRDGQINYIGITSSHGRRHKEMEKIMLTRDLDFIQLTYNIIDREAESRLLPLAREKGIAVIANRPFQRKALFQRVRGKPLPPSAKAIHCQNWAQYFLKFIISHPDISCAIPATSQVAHMQENMAALKGEMPDDKFRGQMLHDIQAI